MIKLSMENETGEGKYETNEWGTMKSEKREA